MFSVALSNKNEVCPTVTVSLSGTIVKYDGYGQGKQRL